MRGNAVAYWCQKDGSEAREYEDAYAVGVSGDSDVWTLNTDADSLRVAVSDGATESMLSGRWARTLVQTCTSDPDTPLRTCIATAQDAWPAILQDYKDAREQAETPIAWYEEPGLDRGAHATLLVAQFDSPRGDGSGTWTAEAIGDSCLFQVSERGLERAFPLAAAAEFDTSPALVHTGMRDPELLDKHCVSVAGTYRSGDHFFLCTDALAAWFLDQQEQRGQPSAIWRGLLACGSPERFAHWVAGERAAGRLKNDDVTLLILRVR